ncbi:MAG: DUF2441 domain-containing protein [Candidatus Woesearchaeota archaeon]
MKKTKGELYINIHRSGEHSNKWKVGNTLSVGNSLNSFVGIYENANISIFNYDALNFIDHVIAVLEKRVAPSKEIIALNSYDVLDTLKHSRNVLNEYVLFMREYIFEEVRKSHYEKHPSRFKGIWVLRDNEESLNYWYKKLINNNQSYNIFRVRLSGTIHEASQDYLEVKTHNLNKWRSLAHEYWKGVKIENAEENEFIFEGKVKILEEIKKKD